MLLGTTSTLQKRLNELLGCYIPYRADVIK